MALLSRQLAISPDWQMPFFCVGLNIDRRDYLLHSKFIYFFLFFYYWEKILFFSSPLGASERWAFYLSHFVLNWISKPSAGRTFVNGQLVNLSEEEERGSEKGRDETHFVLRKGQICIDDASFSILSFFLCCLPPTGNDYKRSREERQFSYATPHPDIGNGRFLPESRGAERRVRRRGERPDRQTR